MKEKKDGGLLEPCNDSKLESESQQHLKPAGAASKIDTITEFESQDIEDTEGARSSKLSKKVANDSAQASQASYSIHSSKIDIKEEVEDEIIDEKASQIEDPEKVSEASKKAESIKIISSKEPQPENTAEEPEAQTVKEEPEVKEEVKKSPPFLSKQPTYSQKGASFKKFRDEDLYGPVEKNLQKEQSNAN